MAEVTTIANAQTTNFVRILICPTKLSGKHDKRYQNKTWEEIINAIDGLCNSGGGTLTLHYQKSPPLGHVRKCMRMLEQKIQDLLGTITLTFDINAVEIPPSSSQPHGEIKIRVTTSTKTENIITLNYHCCLPSSQQVMEIQSSESVDKLRALLLGNIWPQVAPIKAGSHDTGFRKGESVSFSESKTTQFKMLKAEPAKKTTFANRLVGKNNRFSHYVSAFANYAGGYIYVGIDDDGTVKGEFINETEKKKVINKIRTVIDKMKWPKKTEPDGNENKRWDVHFEPVTDGATGKVIQSLYVVVVFVAQCQGGVFIEEPESYEIDDKNKVQKINFSSWKKRIDPRLTEEDRHCSNAPHDLVYEELTNLLNNNCDGNELDEASKKALENYKRKPHNSNVKLICLSKFVSFHLRKGEYDQAEKCLNEYTTTLPSSTNQTYFKVLEQYLYSIMERCKGNYEESYEIAKESLRDLEKLPCCPISAVFYVQIGILENILAINRRECSLMEDSEKHYDTASAHLNNIQGNSATKAEYQQKILINQALLHLGCSLSGDMLPDSDTFINIEKAQEYLLETQKIVLNGYPLGKFRKIQYLFTEACLSYRLSKNKEPSRQSKLLRDALDYSNEAESLAEICNFHEMKNYAKKFIELFKNKLVTFQTKREHNAAPESR